MRNIQGIEINVESPESALEKIQISIKQKNKLNIVFANTNLLNICRKDDHIAELMKGFLILNDGVGLDIASRIKYGEKFPHNLNGTDFCPYVLEHLSPSRIFLLGTTEDKLKKALVNLQSSYAQHSFVGSRNGFFSEDEEAVVIESINQSRADLLIVAFGNPKQEKWIARVNPQLNVGASMCVGAFLDFTSGEIPRAPSWVRKVRMEWVYRLILEPKRMWKRYLVGNVIFLYHSIREAYF